MNMEMDTLTTAIIDNGLDLQGQVMSLLGCMDFGTVPCRSRFRWLLLLESAACWAMLW